MSKMPTDRNADWQKIFDRFGSLDGPLRHKPTSDTARPVSKSDPDVRTNRGFGSVSQPAAKDRRASQ